MYVTLTSVRSVLLVDHGEAYAVRLPLSKKSFPVGLVEKKNASREVGIFFFISQFQFFLKLECTGGKVKKRFFF